MRQMVGMVRKIEKSISFSHLINLINLMLGKQIYYMHFMFISTKITSWKGVLFFMSSYTRTEKSFFPNIIKTD